ncbi:dynein axonemal heavy chain 12-like isoform X2 [Phycodurus eques]|uniref:dynein axonemal heavy chain 12-like isoform X2 n=1 Tax=Phycodurus eques TaxID=693459 RepID=UPI002ACEF9E0|nr:dynein axonemal heavy chain 12-like isoform X2 [Phycodurus eques]
MATVSLSMEFEGLVMKDEEVEDEDDAAVQYMIQQSLLDANKHKQVGTSATTTHSSEGADGVSIFTAIRQGREKPAEDLSVNHKEVFFQTDGRGGTALHEASAQSNRTTLELTYAATGDEALERRTARGETPLFLAVERGLLDNADFLVRCGARPDAQNRDQDSPLLVGGFLYSSRVFKKRILKGGKLNFCDGGGAWRHLRRGAAVDRAGRHDRRPLREASPGDGAAPDARGRFGLTPLALAAQAGHLEVAEVLLGEGADALSQAQDEASVLYESCVGGHLPVHRAAHRGHLRALTLLIPVTSTEDIYNSGMSPLHCAAAGGHAHCIQALLEAGFDPNYMPHPSVRRGYDDERKSALFFAVSNNDLPSVRLLLEAGAMTNQDPVKCLQVALRFGNYELIRTLLRYGANVNFYSRINTTHFPSALQYALNDEVVVRMLCNYGYHVERCFDCPYGNGSHVPEDYEGWTNTVIKDTMFCEVITVSWLKPLSGHVVRVLLDYVDHVTLCSKLKAAVMEQQQWGDICRLQENARCLQHLCRLRIRSCLGRLRLRSPIFMSFLPLPPPLKDYVLYREYDLHGQLKNAHT